MTLAPTRMTLPIRSRARMRFPQEIWLARVRERSLKKIRTVAKVALPIGRLT